MKKTLRLLSLSVILFTIITGLSVEKVSASTLDTNIQKSSPTVRRALNANEMSDFKLLIKLCSDTIYDPKYIDVYEILYPAQTARLRDRLKKIQTSLSSYEKNNNLSDLKHASILLYDELNDIGSAYNAYLMVFNTHAPETKFGGLSECVKRSSELEDLI